MIFDKVMDALDATTAQLSSLRVRQSLGYNWAIKMLISDSRADLIYESILLCHGVYLHQSLKPHCFQRLFDAYPGLSGEIVA